MIIFSLHSLSNVNQQQFCSLTEETIQISGCFSKKKSLTQFRHIKLSTVVWFLLTLLINDHNIRLQWKNYCKSILKRHGILFIVIKLLNSKPKQFNLFSFLILIYKVFQQELLVNDISKIICTSHLNLKEKVLNYYDKFTAQCPKQLQNLNLKMDFSFLNVKEQKYQYCKLLVGFILHPESQLKDLELDSLNLIVFIKTSCEAFEFSKSYFSQCLKYTTQTQKYPMKSIKLTTLKETDGDSVEKFFELFLCSNLFDLHQLTIAGCKQPLIYQLEELHLLDSEEILTQDQAEQQLKMIIFGQKVPVKALSCSINIQKMNPESIQEMDIIQSKIASITLKYNSDNLETTLFCSQVIQKLIFKLNNESILQELEIETKDASAIFNYLSDQIPLQQRSTVEIDYQW